MPPEIPELELEDDSQFVEEPPSEPTDYSGTIPHDAEDER